MIHCEYRQFEPAIHADFVENPSEMVFHSTFSYSVRICDVTVALAIHDSIYDFHLPGGQSEFSSTSLVTRDLGVLRRCPGRSQSCYGEPVDAGRPPITLPFTSLHRGCHPQCIYEIANDFSGNPQFVIHDTSNALEQGPSRRIFRNHTPCAKSQHINNFVFRNLCRQHNDPDTTLQVGNLTKNFKGRFWQIDVH